MPRKNQKMGLKMHMHHDDAHMASETRASRDSHATNIGIKLNRDTEPERTHSKMAGKMVTLPEGKSATPSLRPP